MVELDPLEARILVVDDEPANVKLMTQMLARAGYTNVIATQDPTAVMALFESFEPDLILLDLHMPVLDGFQVLEQLQGAIDKDDFIPVLVLTADATEMTKLRSLTDGANDFLTKPFQYAEMLLRIRNLLMIRMQHTVLRRHNIVMSDLLAAKDARERAAVERGRDITLRTAAIIDEGGPTMLFQPVVDLMTGSLAGVEALSRFPDAAVRTPDRWFTEAAEVGLAVQLELSAIQAAVRQLDELPDDATLAINASADTVRSAALRDLLETLPSDRLVLELTEHERVGDYPGLNTVIEQLRRLGVRLAVDDAGAGFASLQHILHLGPDIIKLDRALIAGLDGDPIRRSLVAALVHFAGETGAHLVAEGIETHGELQTLCTLGVRLGQGYLLARPGVLPVDTAQFAHLLPDR